MGAVGFGIVSIITILVILIIIYTIIRLFKRGECREYIPGSLFQYRWIEGCSTKLSLTEWIVLICMFLFGLWVAFMLYIVWDVANASPPVELRG